MSRPDETHHDSACSNTNFSLLSKLTAQQARIQKLESHLANIHEDLRYLISEVFYVSKQVDKIVNAQDQKPNKAGPNTGTKSTAEAETRTTAQRKQDQKLANELKALPKTYQDQ